MKRYILPVLFILFTLTAFTVSAQKNGQITGKPIRVSPAATETMVQITERAKLMPDVREFDRGEREYPDRSNLPQNPKAKPWAAYPPAASSNINNQPPATSSLAQTLGTSFNGATGPTETGAFPPDDMGAVGPTQYILFVNGRLRSFTKSTGVADGVLNVSPDAFFASVITPPGAGEVSFTSDPRVRYDRLSGKWILIIIDVIMNSTTFATTKANRVLIAYSNSSTITAGTTWTFSQFTGQANTFIDYPTLGVDANALYIGGNMFTLAGSFSGTNAYVINRSTLLSGGAYTVYSFTGLATGTGAGPYTPQGVDNFDPSPTFGYFIGVDNASFGLLQIRRVSNPAGVATLSGNLSVTVTSTTSPRKVPHLGNTGGTSGNLDALDDRLYAAMIRNGHLWTTHNIAVNASGVANTGTSRRNAARWYDITNLGTTPSVNQSGTVFDNTATVTSARDYFIPSIMVSGQGHAAFSLTSAGTNFRSDAYTAGRWSGDATGTMQAPAAATASTTAYNPSGDPGGASGRRWGDYSYVSLDPIDDMTMWMVAQYCSGTNVYGCNVTKLIAPPPATPASCSPAAIAKGQSSVNVTVTGTVVSGSGFYDPGADLASPALPYNHISATVTGGVVVNSVTYTDPTHITLNLNTSAASFGNQTFNVTNPDGQVVASGSVVINIIPDATFSYASGSYCQSGANPAPVFTAASGAGTFSATPAGLVFVSTATGVIDLAASTPGTYTVTNTIATAPGSVKTTTVSIYGNGTWTGSVDANWNTGGNWCGGVPTSGTNIIIPAGGTQPVLSADVAVNNISLSGTIDLNGYTLTINGAVSGAGTFTGSSSSGLTINGTAGTLNFTQTTAATRSLNNLTLNTGSSASLGNALDLYGLLALTSGSFDLAGQHLTLKSVAGGLSGTARVANLTGSTLSNANNVTVERYIANAGHRSWHLLSAKAVTGAQTIFQSWQENGATGVSLPGYGTWVTSNLNNGSNGFDATSISASVLTHNQGGLSGPSWNYNLANTNIAVSSNPAYMVFVRGDRNYTPTLPTPTATSATVLRTDGTLTQGTQAAVTVSATGTGRTLVGNPFASPVDIDVVLTGTANLDPNFYIWDPSLTGNYGVGAFRLVERIGLNDYQATPSIGVGSDNTLRYIHSGQAFFLKATGANANVVFNETDKAGSAPVVNPIVPLGGKEQQLLVNLMIMNSPAEESLADGLRVRFGDGYLSAISDDIEKIGNFAENISSYREGKKLIVERRPMIAGNDTIFLRMTGTAAKNYRLQVSAFDFVQPAITAYLQDTYLGTSTALDLAGGVNNIDFSITADPASGSADRFRIVFSHKKQDIAGTAGISLFPSPVSSRNVTVRFHEMEKGIYQFRLINNLGQVLLNSQLLHVGGSSDQSLDLGSGLQNGTYKLEIIKPDRSMILKNLVILQ